MTGMLSSHLFGQHFEAVHLGHDDVQQHEGYLVLVLLEHRDGFASVLGFQDVVFLVEDVRQHGAVQLGVVHDEDLAALPHAWPPSTRLDSLSMQAIVFPYARSVSSSRGAMVSLDAFERRASVSLDELSVSGDRPRLSAEPLMVWAARKAVSTSTSECVRRCLSFGSPRRNLRPSPRSNAPSSPPLCYPRFLFRVPDRQPNSNRYFTP